MAELFKGYFESTRKVPHNSVIKDAPLKSPPKDSDYVGVLKDEYIQLDFDDESTADIALKIVQESKLRCDVLKTTRGIHLYFLNDGYTTSQKTGVFNAIDLKCDIGLGAKNRVVPLRTTNEIDTTRIINGVEQTVKTVKTTQREWLQTYDELEEIPAFFRPISKYEQGLNKTNTRNQTLFEYILKLQGHGFSREEIRKTIKTINKYILYEPLSDREIDAITRDEAFSEELFFEKSKFLHNRFGDYMLNNSHILNIDGITHIYTEEHLYSNEVEEFEKQMLFKIPSLKDAQRKEVYKYICLKATKKGEMSNARYIGLKDKILDIVTMEEFDYSPKWIISNKIDYVYNTSAYSDIMDNTLNKVACGDSEIRSLLEEMIGYTLLRKNTMQSAFILTGEGSNGKSTILNLVKRLLGKKNYTSLDLRELEDTFLPSQMHNKLANIGDDISAKFLESSSIFKKVVTGESFMAQRKYAQPFEMESYATQIFCANELPTVHDKTDGFNRRIVIIPFNARFKKEDPEYDPFIEEKLMTDESMEYLLKISIDGLKRVLETKSFTKSKVSQDEKKQYEKNNNNVLEWLEDSPKIEHEEAGDVYMAYQQWCLKNGTRPVKQSNLTKEIKKTTSFISKPKYIDGKTVRVYERSD